MFYCFCFLLFLLFTLYLHRSAQCVCVCQDAVNQFYERLTSSTSLASHSCSFRGLGGWRWCHDWNLNRSGSGRHEKLHRVCETDDWILSVFVSSGTIRRQLLHWNSKSVFTLSFVLVFWWVWCDTDSSGGLMSQSWSHMFTVSDFSLKVPETWMSRNCDRMWLLSCYVYKLSLNVVLCKHGQHSLALVVSPSVVHPDYCQLQTKSKTMCLQSQVFKDAGCVMLVYLTNQRCSALPPPPESSRTFSKSSSSNPDLFGR